PMLLLVALPLLSFVSSWALAATKGGLELTDVERQTREFLEYERTIQLTPAQQAVFEQALEALPAPCCSDNTALTCCCPCNAARVWWGLAKHLVANLGYDAAATTAKVDEWFRFINPKGWSGDTCYSAGGCAKPFRENGCGGMSAGQLAF
ncbi:MAG TPA: hypothetical protein VMS86_12035, partial [Thermoanaerobaculia bacterium]|nr:hypothetical protein [Thermoanaerobaculia bacterium]